MSAGGTNGVPHRGPYLVASRDELGLVERLLSGEASPEELSGPVAEGLREKVTAATAANPAFLEPHA